MKSLNTLIRLQKQKVDELRRKLSVLESRKDELLRRSEELAEELKQEIRLAGQYAEMGGFFGDFAGRIRERRTEIATHVQQVERQIRDLNGEMITAFGELKKFEILRDRRIAEKKERERQRENAQMDDIAIQQHLRKHQE